uniref:Secreted protein n=1 Tax=Glycine max TaxID=3847 RepID=K7LZV3_SOYBN
MSLNFKKSIYIVLSFTWIVPHCSCSPFHDQYQTFTDLIQPSSNVPYHMAYLLSSLQFSNTLSLCLNVTRNLIS